jgi:hypothetical protein
MWKNIKDNLFEYSIGFIGFASLGIQFYIFKNEYNDKLEWISNFGDYFGFSAAFLSALVIVLLIRELKEQRESRVKLEKSFDDNANTLKAVKEFFESQSDYQMEQLKHIKIQNIDVSVERINRKYQNDLENVLFFKSKFIETKIKHRTNSSLANLVDLINNKLDEDINSVVEIFEVFNLAYFRLEPFMNSMLNMLNKVEIDIQTHSLTYSSMLEISGLDIIELGLSDKDIHIIKAIANILITLNSILSTEEKLIFGIYLRVYERVYSDRKFSLSLLIYDEIYFETENRLKVRRLLASHLPESMDAINLIKRLNSNEK